MNSQDSFNGVAFVKGRAEAQLRAKLHVSFRGITGILEDGTQLEVPFAGCVITQGGFNDKTYFVSSADGSICLGSDEKQFRQALRQGPGSQADEQLSELRSDRIRQGIRWKSIALAILLLIAGILVAGYYGIMAAARATVMAMPASVDASIGESMAEQVTAGQTWDDPIVQSAMDSIVQRLAPHAGSQQFRFRVYILDGPEVNAFAMPGGHMVVYTELLRQAESPEEVAGVLAHEMAHVTKRHGMQRVAQMLGLSAAFGILLGDTSGLGASFAYELSANGYSRIQESEADEEGVKMMHAAKIDPSGLVKFFDRLKKQSADLPTGMQWISTHPSHASRVEAIEDQLMEMEPKQYEPIGVDWQAVRQRLTQP